MTDRDDPWPAEFDPVAAVFEEQLQTGGHRRDQIVDGATYAKMQAVIEAARDWIALHDAGKASFGNWSFAAMREALRDLDGG